MKKIPIGISEFREIAEKGYYYVDKTNYIEEILESGTKVTLFTRPRRFGKTLNMTMLREFFDIEKDNKSLFTGLAIEQSEYYREINTYPVLYFSFRDAKGEKFRIARAMKAVIYEQYRKYSYIREHLLEEDVETMDQIVANLRESNQAEIVSIETSIQFLSHMVGEYYKKPVIIMIDEYDTPMVEAYVNGFYEELRGSFTALFAGALKDNPYLEKGLLTGIQRIAKENIFSGLNNLEVFTVNDEVYHGFFGLTISETKCMLEYYGLELTKGVQKMYNGYNFGGLSIYNPWSVLNYARRKKLQPFWINTSSNLLIRDLILKKKQDKTFADKFESLIANKEVDVVIRTDTTFWELDTAQTLWGLLLNSGYVTTKELKFTKMTTIKIPNEEVKTEFQNIVSSYADFADGALDEMFYYLIEQYNPEKFKKIYQDIILRTTSYYDAKENAYHMLFLGMCVYLDSYYDIQSNIEVGYGRSDISLTSHNPDKYPNLVIEFKQGEDVKQGVREAMEQIINKKYATGMQGRTLLMGIAHNKKECEIEIAEVIR